METDICIQRPLDDSERALFVIEREAIQLMLRKQQYLKGRCINELKDLTKEVSTLKKMANDREKTRLKMDYYRMKVDKIDKTSQMQMSKDNVEVSQKFLETTKGLKAESD